MDNYTLKFSNYQRPFKLLIVALNIACGEQDPSDWLAATLGRESLKRHFNKAEAISNCDLLWKTYQTS